MKKIIEWTITLIVCMWAVLSLMLLAGEPVKGVTATQTAIVKGLALCSFLLASITCRVLAKRNIIRFGDEEKKVKEK